MILIDADLPGENAPERRCPACGHTSENDAIGCCPICGADGPSAAVTGDDNTPFAQSTRRNRAARKRMRKWICTAPADRMRHLGLIRPSDASRSFARWHLAILMLAGIVFVLNECAWHRVIRTPQNMSFVSYQPTGRGWYSLAVADISPDTFGSVALWFNPLIMVAAVSLSAMTSFLGVAMIVGVLRFGSDQILGQSYRAEERLRAGIQYCMAFFVVIGVASMMRLAIPLSDWLDVMGYRWARVSVAVRVASAVLAGVGALLTWFWIVRLVHTLPLPVRSRVTLYYGVVAPVLVAGVVIAWWMGTSELLGVFNQATRLRW
jgi:hypothetical protein